MNLKNLEEITRLAGEHRELCAAIRQTEICYSMPWQCNAGGHSIYVQAAQIDKIFCGMRDKLEEQMRLLGVTDFNQW